MNIEEVIKSQRDYFKTGTTKNVDFRIEKLKILKDSIKDHEEEILKALNIDLNKSKLEGYATEIGVTLNDIDYAIKNIKKWSKKIRHKTSIINFPASSYTIRNPYGLALIISPWNYPFNLALQPLIGALAGGNCVILKPSEFSLNTSKVISKIIDKCFKPEYVAVVEGDKEVNKKLLKEKFDYIFFTGSPRVGQIVMEAASKHLTPVTLELGGKSPCIVFDDADIDIAAKRIVWGKLINSGQTCIAPDYLLVHTDVKDELIRKMIRTIKEFYGKNPLDSEDYGKIINQDHFERLITYLDNSKILHGGDYNKETLSINPTFIDDVSLDDNIMKEEIFGPILPILEFKDIEEIFDIIEENPTPLALYLFTRDKNIERKIVGEISFGGGCINDTVMHVSSHTMPFGGVGESGMGSYHGKKSFDTFTHQKSILKKSTFIDIPLRYPPYKDKLKWVEKIFK